MTIVNITPDRLLDIMDEVLNDNVEVGFKPVPGSDPAKYEPVFGIIKSGQEFWQLRLLQTSRTDIENHLYDLAHKQGYIIGEEGTRTPNQNLKHYISLALNIYVRQRYQEYQDEHGVADLLM